MSENRDPKNNPLARRVDHAHLLLHLSDVHLFAASSRQGLPSFWSNLLLALKAVAKEAKRTVAVAITGDVIDSSEVLNGDVVTAMTKMFADLRSNLGANTLITVLPGNHDRRSEGVIRPWSCDAVNAMRTAAQATKGIEIVAPERGERHALAVPALSKALDAEVVAYDSTHTYRGFFSAGGYVRTDDLLSVGSIVASEKPVVVLMHHHLVPTPVTDVGVIQADEQGWTKRTLVKTLLPWLVSFGDREELLMTALGAGTMLTALHALQSPIIVLHGHKHYPTARVLKATMAGDGDLIVTSAGSTGLAEPYEVGKLWPSFNAVWIASTRVDVETVFFSPKDAEPIYRQALVAAARSGPSWNVEATAAPPAGDHQVKLDESVFTVGKQLGGRWNFECERWVKAVIGLDGWSEPIVTAPGGVVKGEDIEHDGGVARLRVTPGTRSTYKAERALYASREEARRGHGEDTSPFEWLGLTVRKPSARARIEVRGLPQGKVDGVFATVTDLHTGERRPVKPNIANGIVTVDIASCPARRFVQVLWPI